MCNGSTPDSDSVCGGSNPSSSAKSTCLQRVLFRYPFIRHHRTIASASLRRLFAPLLQCEKPEIHTGFLRFPNFESGQKSCLRLLAELRGAAIKMTRPVFSGGGSSEKVPAGVFTAQIPQIPFPSRRTGRHFGKTGSRRSPEAAEPLSRDSGIQCPAPQ